MDLPHPLDAHILSPWAQQKTSIVHNTQQFSVYSTHHGNSSIIFWNQEGSGITCGFIFSICILPLEGCTILLISPHEQLSAEDAEHDPYLSLPGLQCSLVYTHNPSESSLAKLIIIDVDQIVSHVPYYLHTQGTFGIQSPITILSNSLQCSM
jgi:hypothetical protein